MDGNTLFQNDYLAYTPSPREHESCVGLYCKWIRDENHTRLYSIAFKFYEFEIPGMGYAHKSCEATCQFNTRSGLTFNVEVLVHDDDTLESIEALFANVYANTECVPYD